MIALRRLFPELNNLVRVTLVPPRRSRHSLLFEEARSPVPERHSPGRPELHRDASELADSERQPSRDLETVDSEEENEADDAASTRSSTDTEPITFQFHDKPQLAFQFREDLTAAGVDDDVDDDTEVAFAQDGKVRKFPYSPPTDIAASRNPTAETPPSEQFLPLAKSTQIADDLATFDTKSRQRLDEMASLD